ncbi:hypothetical protein J6590_066858 [Homalodisca vitripennis]|nr:hypothetical protein J6590_066858 [Homalodisca vitripennis]
MTNTWMGSVGPNTFSVFGQSHRTNNALEGFYSLLLKRMGLTLGSGLSMWLDYRRISDGILHLIPTRRASRQDRAIHVASEQLMLGQCNVAQFLDRMSHCTRRLQERLGRRREAAQERQPAAPVMPPAPDNQVPPVTAAVPALPRPVMSPPLDNQVPHVAAAAIEPVDDEEEVFIE